MESALHVPEADLLAALSAGIVEALEAIRVPAYIVDLQRRIRWQNAASIGLVGELRGRLDSSVGLDPKDLVRARQAFARKLNGAAHTQLGSAPGRRRRHDRELRARPGARRGRAHLGERAVAQPTVRNHVKRVLRSLGARSRVEAVAKGRQAGLT